MQAPNNQGLNWYLRYSLSFRDVEELLRERGLEADHTTIWRWVQHHVQVDVTFLKLVGKDGRATRRYQYTAIDDATRIRTLKVSTRRTQKNTVHFLDEQRQA